VNVPADSPRLDEADFVLARLDEVVVTKQPDGHVVVRRKA
jgi:sugar-phosphatase